MRAFVTAYNTIIIIIALVMAAMLARTPFRADTKLLIAIITSAITFPLTAWFLYNFYRNQKNRIAALVFLIISLLIFSYYLSDLLFHTLDGISLLLLVIMGIVFILTIAFIIDLSSTLKKSIDRKM